MNEDLNDREEVEPDEWVVPPEEFGRNIDDAATTAAAASFNRSDSSTG